MTGSEEFMGVLTGQVPVRSAPIAMSKPHDTEDETDDDGSQ